MIAGLAALIPAVVSGIPAGHDLPSHLRFAIPFYNAIHAGTFHPGWLAEANGGFGDPGIRFYPPALYYLLAATRTLTASWYSGILLCFILLSVLGAVGVFFWARCFLPRNLAIVGGVLYALIPYRINEFYGASLLAEYVAASVLPFAFAFVLRICRGQHIRDGVGLAISFALLVLSNLPVAVPNEVEAKERAVGINSWEPEMRTFWIGSGPAQEIRARTFYYPYWVAKTSTVPLNTRPDYDGALLISVPAGPTSVRLEFQEPLRTRIAMTVTVAAWLLICLCLLYSYLGTPRK